ncbi:apolipoprotein acyltransferase [Citreicella sp. C3M06]|uniref:apolipoprotein acyltransferase n=1 Tax=Roseobacteraceae TaxID=2854170 RepID=UPI001C09745C|nr:MULTISPECIES: apolipoprotein acyltransferase [Roseobacteraceae]MBU2962829.1 apolipoprotein acyltransferase [Citreicella sp. C3M06]MDO6587527.1 apolipoprotein acyltransferase [Salipiger sp. 1_MG-2023]
MIVIAGVLIGAILGGLTARRRKGNAADIAQYATGFAIACGLAGFVLTIILEKLLT